MESQETTYEKVKSCLVDVLSVDEEEVTPEAALIDDLGAESIDFVDIIFRLEKSFGMKIPRGELFPQDFFSNKEFVKDGKFTTTGVDAFRTRYPFIDIKSDDGGIEVSKLTKSYTVDMLVKFIQLKQQSK